jgi:hypothetical protein
VSLPTRGVHPQPLYTCRAIGHLAFGARRRHYKTICTISLVVVIREASNELTRFDLQSLRPNKVTIWRNTTSPLLKLRYESVDLGSDFVGEFALG